MWCCMLANVQCHDKINEHKDGTFFILCSFKHQEASYVSYKKKYIYKELFMDVFNVVYVVYVLYSRGPLKLDIVYSLVKYLCKYELLNIHCISDPFHSSFPTNWCGDSCK